jgi:L-malate glycosyltransferase
MKVLVLANATYADPPTRRVFDAVAARGVEVVLAMPKRIRHPFGPSVVPPTPWETPVRLVLLDTWYLHENGTHVVMKGLRRLIRRLRPDVIHCVLEPWAITCQIVALTIALSSHKPRFGMQAVETIPRQGSVPASVIRQALYRLVLSRADYFIGWSQRVIDAAARLGLNGTLSATLPAVAVDTHLFKPMNTADRDEYRSRLGWTDAEFVVGFVGRLEKHKGVIDLISAMDIAILRESRLRLVILGTGSLNETLRHEASYRPWMTLLPPLDATGVARHYGALDALAVPSRTTPLWEEQFGLVVPEAMACGTPVIAARSGALPETVNEAGLLFPEGDPDSLSRCILALAGSRELADDLRGRGLARASVLYSTEPIADRLKTIWSAQ